MFHLLFFIMVCLPLADDSGGDVIVAIEGSAEGVGFADLDGDALCDLIVMAAPVEPPYERFPRVQIYLQKQDRSFERLHLPVAMLKDVMLADLGDFTPDPGQELMLLDTRSMRFIHVGKKGEAIRSAGIAAENPLFHRKVRDAPHLLDFTADVDGNGYHDPIIPTAKGHAVHFSRGDGTFRAPVLLPGTVEWSTQFSDNTFFSLVTVIGKIRALAHPGGSPLLITEMAGKLITHELVGRTFHAMESLHHGFGSYAPHRKGTIQYSGIMFARAMKKGGPSFVRSRRTASSGLLAELSTTHTVYELEPNRPAKKLEIIALQKIVTDGISAPPVFSDLDSDGHDDLVLVYVKTGFLSKLLEFLLDRVVITCQAHRYEPDEGRFSFAPVWSDEVSAPSSSFRKVGSEGLVQFNGDYSGDRRPDMVVYDGDRLLIRRGERDEGFLATDEIAFQERPFFQIGPPFPGPVFSRNVDRDECPEIITYGGPIVRIIHVR